MNTPTARSHAFARQDVFALLVLLAAVVWPFRDALVGDGCMLSFDTRRTGFAPFQVEKPPDVDSRPANLVTSDINGWIVPEVELMVREMRAGRAPLWNPYVLCGQPLLANLAFSPFYPPNWLALVLDPLRALAWIVVLHFWLAGAFAYAWARRHGLARGPALLSALAVALTTWLTTRFHLPSIAMTAAWLPGLLLAFDRLASRPVLGRALGLGVVVGGACLAGFPQLAMLELFGLAVYAVVRMLQERPPFVRTAGFAVSAVALGVGLAAIQLGPTVALYAESLRALHSDAIAGRGLRLAALLGAFHPHAFGDPVRLLGRVGDLQDYLGFRQFLPRDIQENAVENALWIGVLPLALAFAAVFDVRHRRALLAAFVVATIGLALAFGLPLPGLQAGSPKRALALVVVPLAMLAGFGWDALARRRPTAFAPTVTFALLVVLGLGYVVCLAVVGDGGVLHGMLVETGETAADVKLFCEHFAETTRPALYLVGASILALALLWRFPKVAIVIAVGTICLDLGSFARGFNPAQERSGQYPSTPAVKFALESGERTIRAIDMTPLPALIGPLFGYRSADGGEPMVTRNVAELYEALEPGRFDPRDPRVMRPFTDMKVFADPLFLRTATSLVVANRVLELQDADVAYASEAEGMGIYRLRNAVPRVRLVEGWWNGADLTRLREADADPRRVVSVDPAYLNYGSAGPLEPPGPVDAPAGSARIVREAPNEVTIEVKLAARPNSDVDVLFPKEAWLVLADTFDPGWTATRTDEGSEPVAARVFTADHAFRAVRVSSKTREVTFKYEPRAFFMGAKISAFAWILLLCGVLEAAFVQRRRATAA